MQDLATRLVLPSTCCHKRSQVLPGSIKGRMIERAIEKFLFANRWLLAPFFIALALALVVLLAKMALAFYEFFLHAWSASEADVILSILGLWT